MMQRLSIARAMMHDPQVLFLDEPSAGLDPQTRLLLWEIIREYNQSGKTILLTTHNMEEADALCQRLAIIDHGRNIALGTPAELKASVPGGFLLRVRFGSGSVELLDRLRMLEGVRELQSNADDVVDIYADRGGPLVSEIANIAAASSAELSDVHISEPSLENLFLHHTFLALLARDAHVARRNIVQLLLQTFLQPMMFVFIFGRVMVSSGYMQPEYKSLLLPGIMAISMVFTGVWAVAMPLIGEFQFTHEIEDRLLAPIENHWLAIEKVCFGAAQAVVAGLAVIPAAWLLLRPVEIHLLSPLPFAGVTLLVAFLSACGGLALGCSVGQNQIGLMFSLVLTPMIFFGCAYYPWSTLVNFPILQKAVLINPLVYASEGLRGTLVPQFPHLPMLAVLPALLVFDSLLLMLGLRQFRRKAVA
jgi:ABC-type multidrug transport system permease subunit